MAGLLPIQLGQTTNGQTAPLASTAGADVTVSDFAAILSGLLNPGNGSTTRSEAPGAAKTVNPDTGTDLQPAAAASPEQWSFDPAGGSETLSAAAVEPLITGTGLETSPPAEVKPLPIRDPAAEKVLAASEMPGTPTNEPNDVVQSSNATPQPKSVVSGGERAIGVCVGPNLDALAPDANSKSLAQDSSSLDDLLAGVVPVTQSGDISNEALPGRSTKAALPVAPGKASDGRGDSHIRPHRPADDLVVAPDLAQIGQDVSTVALAPPSQPTPMPAPLLDRAAAVTAGTSGDGGKPVEPSRSLLSNSAKVQLPAPNHPSGRVLPPGLSTTEAEPEKLAVKSDPVPETATLAVRAEVPQATPFAVSSSALLPADRAPPAAPTDQIAPALVGILQKTDGQQSVTVHLQPAELGQVQIRVDQTASGTAHIAITAEKPETLQMLQREEPRLQQVLDQAGVSSNGRTVSFQAASQEQIGAAASRSDSMETGAGASGQGQSGGAWRQNGDAQNDFGRGSGADQEQHRPRWFRAGLDITA